MNYKLINKTTNEESICSKVVVDGFDYYVSDETSDKIGDIVYNEEEDEIFIILDSESLRGLNFQVITTNNPSIDLPQVIDEVEELAKTFIKPAILEGGHSDKGKDANQGWRKVWKEGYNKAQESHPYSKEDMLNLIQSLKDYTHESHSILGQDEREPIELLEIWESKQIKTLYYE